MNDKTKRTHDLAVYLEESRYDSPKENIKAWLGHLRKAGVPAHAKFGDFGCAAGELLYQAGKAFPGSELAGFDVVPELVEKARHWVPAGKFSLGSVLDPAICPENSFDVVSLFGVHSIFDEFEPIFSNLIRWTKPGGKAYVFGNFNAAPVDVWVQYRLSNDPDRTRKEVGWNIYSKESIGKFLRSQPKVKAHAFLPFELPIDLPPHPNDPVRSYSIVLDNGKRMQTNGLSLLHDQYFLEISC